MKLAGLCWTFLSYRGGWVLQCLTYPPGDLWDLTAWQWVDTEQSWEPWQDEH